jgi:type 1 fimbria pilin
MKKLITLMSACCIMLLAISAEVLAQSSDTGSIAVTGTVIEALNLEGEEDLIFGEIVAGESKTINLSGDVTDGTVITGTEQAGRFRVGGPAGFNILLEYTVLPNVMNGIGAATGNTLPVAYVSGFNPTDNATGATPLPVTGSTETELTGGELFVFLGGTVSPAVGQVTGDYETQVTLSVTFAD